MEAFHGSLPHKNSEGHTLQLLNGGLAIKIS